MALHCRTRQENRHQGSQKSCYRCSHELVVAKLSPAVGGSCWTEAAKTRLCTSIFWRQKETKKKHTFGPNWVLVHVCLFFCVLLWPQQHGPPKWHQFRSGGATEVLRPVQRGRQHGGAAQSGAAWGLDGGDAPQRATRCPGLNGGRSSNGMAVPCFWADPKGLER